MKGRRSFTTNNADSFVWIQNEVYVKKLFWSVFLFSPMLEKLKCCKKMFRNNGIQFATESLGLEILQEIILKVWI